MPKLSSMYPKNCSVGRTSKVAILPMISNKIWAFPGIITLMSGKWATIYKQCSRPQSIFIAPDKRRLTVKLPIMPAFVIAPIPSLTLTNASVKAVLGILFGAFTESVDSLSIKSYDSTE